MDVAGDPFQLHLDQAAELASLQRIEMKDAGQRGELLDRKAGLPKPLSMTCSADDQNLPPRLHRYRSLICGRSSLRPRRR
ncbi:MAG: hypothetical protein METHAR1v1_670003 [Methanothrix sp.]|nr:MAG: hypothetical protein METHAR1v1_670003 [Methanothrix sp.]